MMLCDPCLSEHYTNYSAFRSHGRCEYCKKTSSCSDIPSRDLNPKSKPDPAAYNEHRTHLLREYHRRLVILLKTAEQDEMAPGYALRCSMDAAHAARARTNFELHEKLTVQEFNDKVAADIAVLFPEKKEN